MTKVTAEQLAAYLDDALGDAETAAVERALRESETLRKQLSVILQERDRGDHSIGSIWRQERLTCPTREQLGSYLLQVIDDGQQEYIDFHLHSVGCAFCQANLADLQTLNAEAPKAHARRRRFFESSAGLLQAVRRPR